VPTTEIRFACTSSPATPKLFITMASVTVIFVFRSDANVTLTSEFRVLRYQPTSELESTTFEWSPVA
jgi:hypothetical protein